MCSVISLIIFSTVKLMLYIMYGTCNSKDSPVFVIDTPKCESKSAEKIPFLSRKYLLPTTMSTVSLTMRKESNTIDITKSHSR